MLSGHFFSIWKKPRILNVILTFFWQDKLRNPWLEGVRARTDWYVSAHSYTLPHTHLAIHSLSKATQHKVHCWTSVTKLHAINFPESIHNKIKYLDTRSIYIYVLEKKSPLCPNPNASLYQNDVCLGLLYQQLFSIVFIVRCCQCGHCSQSLVFISLYTYVSLSGALRLWYFAFLSVDVECGDLGVSLPVDTCEPRFKRAPSSRPCLTHAQK